MCASRKWDSWSFTCTLVTQGVTSLTLSLSLSLCVCISPAAVILFVGYQDIALKVFEAAALHPVLGSSQVLWVGVDAWTGLELQDTTLLPKGTIGITPQVAYTPVTEQYLARWAALPAEEYPSLHEASGGSREVLATYSSTLVDATLALGLALQHAIDQHQLGEEP